MGYRKPKKKRVSARLRGKGKKRSVMTPRIKIRSRSVLLNYDGEDWRETSPVLAGWLAGRLAVSSKASPVPLPSRIDHLAVLFC